MGIQEFGAVFDILDPARQGFITAEQIQQFHETLHFSPIIRSQVDAAILQVCGPDANGKVHKHFFVQVLLHFNIMIISSYFFAIILIRKSTYGSG